MLRRRTANEGWLPTRQLGGRPPFFLARVVMHSSLPDGALMRAANGLIVPLLIILSRVDYSCVKYKKTYMPTANFASAEATSTEKLPIEDEGGG